MTADNSEFLAPGYEIDPKEDFSPFYEDGVLKIYNPISQKLTQNEVRFTDLSTNMDHGATVIDVNIDGGKYPLLMPFFAAEEFLKRMSRLGEYLTAVKIISNEIIEVQKPLFQDHYRIIPDLNVFLSYFNSISEHQLRFEYEFTHNQLLGKTILTKLVFSASPGLSIPSKTFIAKHVHEWASQERDDFNVHYRKNLIKVPEGSVLGDISEEERTMSVIREKIEGIDNKGWEYVFHSKIDYEVFAALLGHFFESKDYEIPEKKIRVKKGCKTRLASALGELYTELLEVPLKSNIQYFNLLRVLVCFENEPHLYKAVTR